MHAAVQPQPPSARVFLLRLAASGRTPSQGLRQRFGDAPPGLGAVSANNPPPVERHEIDMVRHGQEALSLLDSEELEKAGRLRDDGARQAYLLAHAALRLLLARALGRDAQGLRFAAGPLGKPRLADDAAAVHFSLARRPGLVALAIGNAPLGVDVEPLREGVDMAGISQRFFTPGEHAFVLGASAPQAALERFFGLWSRKEALVKAAGVGIDALGRAEALKSLVTLANEEGSPRTWCLHQLPSPPDCALAMAIEVPGPPAPTDPT